MPARRARAGGSCRPKAIRIPDQVREVLRYHHYAYKTAQICMHRSLRFIRFDGTRYPARIHKPEPTFARFGNCPVTGTSRQRKCIRTSWTRI
jgi:hypothetical protein